MRSPDSLVLPTVVVSSTLGVFFLFATICDHRNTYGNALWVASILGIVDLSGRSIALIFVSLALFPLPFLAYCAVRMTHFGEHTRVHTPATAAAFPIGAFLFLFEMTFAHTNDKSMRRDILLTRLFLIYLFSMVVLSLWLGFPYKEKAWLQL